MIPICFHFIFQRVHIDAGFGLTDRDRHNFFHSKARHPKNSQTCQSISPTLDVLLSSTEHFQRILNQDSQANCVNSSTHSTPGNPYRHTKARKHTSTTVPADSYPANRNPQLTPSQHPPKPNRFSKVRENSTHLGTSPNLYLTHPRNHVSQP